MIKIMAYQLQPGDYWPAYGTVIDCDYIAYDDIDNGYGVLIVFVQSGDNERIITPNPYRWCIVHPSNCSF